MISLDTLAAPSPRTLGLVAALLVLAPVGALASAHVEGCFKDTVERGNRSSNVSCVKEPGRMGGKKNGKKFALVATSTGEYRTFSYAAVASPSTPAPAGRGDFGLRAWADGHGPATTSSSPTDDSDPSGLRSFRMKTDDGTTSGGGKYALHGKGYNSGGGKKR